MSLLLYTTLGAGDEQAAPEDGTRGPPVAASTITRGPAKWDDDVIARADPSRCMAAGQPDPSQYLQGRRSDSLSDKNIEFLRVVSR